MAIDFHAHWIPPRLAHALRQRSAAPRIEETRQGEEFVSWQGRMPLLPLMDLRRRRELMGRLGVEMQVLSLAGLFGIDCLPARESLPLTAAFNDEAALACGQPQFAALAALPLADMPAACRELERARTLGLSGAILPADGFASLDTAERYRALFEIGNGIGCHFFIHPGPLEPQAERHLRHVRTDNAWQRRIVLETQARLSEAVVTLCLSDYLAPYPKVTVQIANLGGTIPFLLERMWEVKRSHGDSSESALAGFRRCYVDTASFGPRGIDMAVACFGADRILLGTDCPIFDPSTMLQAVASSRLDASTQELIRSGNARELLHGQK